MQQLLKQLVVIISAIMLVIASGGFSLYQHYCNCAKEISNTILSATSDCQESSKNQSCCVIPVEKETSCCKTETDQNDLHNQCGESDNCCASEVTFLKTDDFNLSFVQKKSFHFITAFVNILESTYLNIEETFTKETNFIADLPPPNFGKEFLILLHQLKIAPPIA